MSDQVQAPKQLSMSITAQKVRQLPDVELPDGYVLRGYHPGDEVGWSALLHMGGFTDWDPQKIITYLGKQRDRREGSRVVSRGGEIIAALFASRQKPIARSVDLNLAASRSTDERGKASGAVHTDILRRLTGTENSKRSRVFFLAKTAVAKTFASLRKSPAKVGLLDFLVTHPDHRGKGLGRVVCTAMLRALVDRDYESVILLTDDWRLPAINLYLSMGFVPEMTQEDMSSRWEAITNQLEELRMYHCGSEDNRSLVTDTYCIHHIQSPTHY